MKERAIQFLRDVVKSGDIIRYHHHSIVEWEFTYSISVVASGDASVDIGHAMAEALAGRLFNDGRSTVQIRKGPGRTVISLSNARSLTEILGDLLELPAYCHFDLEVIHGSSLEGAEADG